MSSEINRWYFEVDDINERIEESHRLFNATVYKSLHEMKDALKSIQNLKKLLWKH